MTTETPTDLAAAARTVYLFGATPGTPRELRDALLGWARANDLDPDRVIGSEAAVVDLVDRTISYKTPAEPAEPGAKPYGKMWVRAVTVPLLVDPPAELRHSALGYVALPVTVTARPAGDAEARLAALRALYVELADGPPVSGDWLLAELGRLTRDADDRIEHAAALFRAGTRDGALWRQLDRLAAALGMTWSIDDHGLAVLDAAADRLAEMSAHQALPFGWARYARTCDPDRLLSGLGDLCYFLGGEWGSDGGGDASFTAHLLKLIVKAQATPERFAALERAFPREVLAWRVWMNTDQMPTAAGLCAALTALTGDRA
jgi:hypothetical protein